MKRNSENALKRFLKRKNQITESLIVIFLITGGVAYGGWSDISDFGNGAGHIRNNTDIIKGGINVIISGSDPSERFKIKRSGNGLTGYMNGFNAGIISGEVNLNLDDNQNKYTNLDDSGNGVLLVISGGDNRGVISGRINIKAKSPVSVIGSGNGVLEKLNDSNTGVISGEVDASIEHNPSTTIRKSGNGIYGRTSYGELDSNTGVLSGRVNVVINSSERIFVEDSGSGTFFSASDNRGVMSGKVNIATSDALSILHSGNANSMKFDDGAMNRGVMSGKINTTTTVNSNPLNSLYTSIRSSGNGVDGSTGDNKGVISGGVNVTIINSSGLSQLSHLRTEYSGNGVNSSVKNNSGSITGVYSVDAENFSIKDYEVITMSGNGIHARIRGFKNSGLVAGSESAVAINDAGSLTGSITNYGIFAGREIIGDGTEIIVYEKPIDEIPSQYEDYGELAGIEGLTEDQYKNYGIEIKFNNDENRTIGGIKEGEGGPIDIDGTSYTILNGEVYPIESGADSYHVVDIDTTYDNYIINGAGVGTGALTIDNSQVTLNNSIVNGYEKSITLNGESTLTATDTIFNGGGIGKWDDNGTPDDNTDDLLEYTSVIEGDSGNNTLNLSGESIINGKVDLGDGMDTVTISDNSLLNGEVTLGSGDDTMIIEDMVNLNGNIDLGDGIDNLTIANTVQINGDLYGGAGKDVLNLGDGTTTAVSTKTDEVDRGIHLFHTIGGFEEIKVKGIATLYETAKVEGGESIHIEKNSSLNLRVDPTKTDDDDKVIGHALYNSGATITGESAAGMSIEGDTNKGVLNLITNGLGDGATIAMGSTTLDEKLYVRTDSILSRAQVDGSDVTVVVGDGLDWIFGDPTVERPVVDPIIPVTPIDPSNPIEDDSDPLTPIDPSNPIEDDSDPLIPLKPSKPKVPEWATGSHYQKLDLMYKSVFSSDDSAIHIDALYPTVNRNDKTEDEAGENLLVLLNDIFMANPYGYAARTSKDSMGLFNEMVLNNPFRANEGNWMIYGGLTFGGDDYDSGYKNHIKGSYYGFDDYGIDINTDSDIYGGYALAEYGLSKDTSIGFIAGGANSNTSISNGSKIDGDSIYVGGYTKTEKNNFRLIAGLGYQYGDYDTIRVAGNSYQSNKYEEEISTNGFTAYAGLTYDYAINDKWSLEPKVNLSYARISQESVEEEGILSIETDKESFNYVDTELGMDLVRNILFEDGEGKVKLGVSYVYALDGSDNDYVTGRFQGGSDFDILVPEREKGTVKIKGSFDVEHNNGVIYSVGGGYLPSENRDEYYASVGIGFKFNNLKDFIPAKTSNTSNVKKEIKTSTVVDTIADVKSETQEINNTAIINNINGFNLNSSKLTREMEKELDKAALEIQKKKLEEIKVTGHTDNTGPKAFNEKLSLKRAESAKSQLLKTLPEVEISTKGEGNNQPLESNDTLEGRRKNRRIEIQY